MMKAILPLAAALVIGATPALAESFKDEPAPVRAGPSLYERISAHYGPMGRDVKEKYRDGPCGTDAQKTAALRPPFSF